MASGNRMRGLPLTTVLSKALGTACEPRSMPPGTLPCRTQAGDLFSGATNSGHGLSRLDADLRHLALVLVANVANLCFVSSVAGDFGVW